MTYLVRGILPRKQCGFISLKEIMHGKATAKVFIGQHSGKCKCRKERYMESVNDRSFTLKPYTLHNGCPHIQWRAPFVPFLKAKSVLSSFPLVMTGMYVSCVIQKHLEQTMERRKRRIYCTLYSSYIEVVLTFYFVKIERISYLCISKPSLKFLSCTKYWTKIQ